VDSAQKSKSSTRLIQDFALPVILFGARRVPRQRNVGMFMPGVHCFQFTSSGLLIEDCRYIQLSIEKGLYEMQVAPRVSNDAVVFSERAPQPCRRFVCVNGVELQPQT